MSRTIIASLAAALVAMPAIAAPTHDSIDVELAKAAPSVIKAVDALKAQDKEGIKYFGVLKFLVRKGDGKLDDAVGELNQGLADRLETALILASKEDDGPILFYQASRSVPKDKAAKANHGSLDGRKAMFKLKFAPAWGGGAADLPSAFVSGVAEISKDLKTLTIRLQVFGPDGALVPIGEPIVVATTRRTLVEAGYSYVLNDQNDGGLRPRGGRTRPKEVVDQNLEDKVVTAATQELNQKPAEEKVTAESALKSSPVKLEVRYNGTPVKVEGDRIAEPKESDSVSFFLKNTDPTCTYGAVLKVNGKNTLFEEEAEPMFCLKWILKPGQEVEITGFQTDDNKRELFRIKSATESKEGLIRYGDLAGTVRLVIFQGEQTDKDPKLEEPPAPPEVNEQLLVYHAVARGTKAMPVDRPTSLNALRAALKGRANDGAGSRGMIGKGKEESSNIQRIFFKPTPSVPVADVTIRYYDPSK